MLETTTPNALRTTTGDRVDSPQILVCDDDPDFHGIVKYLLRDTGYRVRCVSSPSEIGNGPDPSAILLDWQLGTYDGTTLIQPFRQRFPLSPIIFATGHSLPEVAATAIQQGAFDFLTKPVDEARLKMATAKAIQQHHLLVRLHRYERTDEDGFEGMIGTSPQMQTVYSAIRNVAPTEVSVMVSGESGTGKERVATAIHQRSDRAAGPFVALNMASIPEELAESLLFGHEKGSFTGAERRRLGAVREAEKGTLFLDEITEMPIQLQGKLLRFLQEGTFRPVGADREMRADTRIVSATNRDPVTAIREQRLREDLYYRLCVVPIQLPPLREREGDVPLLVHHALRQFAKEHRKDFDTISPEAMEALVKHGWPGNVRELVNVVERITVLNHGEVVEPHMLPVEFHAGEFSNCFEVEDTTVDESGRPAAPLAAFDSKENIVSMEELEREALAAALRLCNGSAYEAARRLKISTATIYRKIKLYGLRGE